MSRRRQGKHPSRNPRRTRSSAPSKRSAPKARSRFSIWTRRLIAGGVIVALLGVIALGTAVYFAARSMPGYASLMSSQNGQTIVVRARDAARMRVLGRDLNADGKQQQNQKRTHHRCDRVIENGQHHSTGSDGPPPRLSRCMTLICVKIEAIRSKMAKQWRGSAVSMTGLRKQLAGTAALFPLRALP